MGDKKGRERPKITLIVVKNDISIKEVTKSMTSNRIESEKRIHMVNHEQSVEKSITDPKILRLRLGGCHCWLPEKTKQVSSS